MSDDGSRHSVLWIGPITAFVAMLLLVPMAVVFLAPAIQNVREARQRAQVRENLRTIGIALANYHDQQAQREMELPSPDAPADATNPASGRE